MSFAVSRNRGEFEWAGQDLGTVFAQWKNVWNVDFLRTLVEIVRFNTVAADLLALPDHHPERTLSLGEYLTLHGYSTSFANDYLLPMTAAIW